MSKLDDQVAHRLRQLHACGGVSAAGRSRRSVRPWPVHLINLQLPPIDGQMEHTDTTIKDSKDASVPG